MSSPLDITNASAVLKEYYSKQRVEQLTYKDAPLYALVPKVKDFFGDTYPLPMRVTNPQGASANFATAQANKEASNYKKFQLTRVKDYSLASISTEAILASSTNAGAFLQLATAEIDGAMDTMKRRAGWALYGNGSGSIGQVNAAPAIAATTVITLKNVDDVVRFEVGQTVNIWSAESGGSQRTTDGSDSSWKVTNVDRDLGVIVLDDAFTGSGTIAANDHIFVEGDRGAKISGLAAWIPSTTPSATPFFGVDRSVDATRLGGIRVQSAGKPIDEALIDAARRVGREGLGSPDYVFCSFDKYASLEKTLGARIRYKEVSVAGIGFKGIEVTGPQATMTVLPDRDCPSDKMYMLEMSTWALYSLKDPIMLLDQDGNRMLREGSADAHEVRIGGYFQLGCNSPGSNAVLLF